MLTKDAIQYFSEIASDSRGARTRMAKALGVTSGAISQWGELVPEGQAYKLESLTHGRLKVNPALYRKH